MLARGSPLARLLALVSVLALMVMAQIGSAIASAPLEVAPQSVDTVQALTPAPLVDVVADFSVITAELGAIAVAPSVPLALDVATAAPIGDAMKSASDARPTQRDAFLIVNQSTGARSRT